jgi:hypothetical protein
MSESALSTPPATGSPPPAERPVVDDAAIARDRLRRLAGELSRTQDRRRLVEYLRLRRSLR